MYLGLALGVEDSKNLIKEEEEKTDDDHFDRLPDALLLTVFNKLGDIKAVGRCCVVSKRFHSLASQVDNVVVKVDCVISGEEANGNVKSKGIMSSFVKFVYGSILKPFHALQQLLVPKKSKGTEVSHHSPGEVLKNFKEIQKLKIELPGGELGIEEDILLKWKAEFGSTVESCVILGAYKHKKIEKCDVDVGDKVEYEVEENDNGSIPESFYTDGSLKSRVVWTISSLIAASARHYLLQQIIWDHPTVDCLELTDADGQGSLHMNKEQLQEFREKPSQSATSASASATASSASSNRTQVPALNMKLWYAPYLRLSDGTVLKGATLVAIRPGCEKKKSKEKKKEDDEIEKESMEAIVGSAFGEPYASAAALLVRRRTYLLEMNSF